MDNKQVRVSVIVPIYNVEEYLERCLESILCQKEKNIQIICIEDCSTDASPEILKRIGKKDRRIQIVQNKKNQGLSYCRNLGIDLAKGEFIVFVDSDDYMPDYAIMEMYQYAKNNKLGLLYCDVELVSDAGKINNAEQRRIRKGIYKAANGATMFQQMVKYHEMFGAVWGVLYKTSFIKDNVIRFRNGILHEDIPFTFRAILSCEKAGCMQKICYYYVQRPNSILSSNNLAERLEGLLIAYFDMLIYWYEYENKSKALNESVSEFIRVYYKGIQNMFMQIEYSELIKYPLLEYLKDLDVDRCNKCIEISEKDMDIIRESSRVVIYGAGNIAIKVLDFLNKNNIHVDAFIVTDLKENPRVIRKVPVVEKHYLEDRQTKTAIIIGVSEKYRDEIKRQLRVNENQKIIDSIGFV